MIKLIDLLQEGIILKKGVAYIIKDTNGTTVIDKDATFTGYAHNVAHFDGDKHYAIPEADIDKRVSPQN